MEMSENKGEYTNEEISKIFNGPINDYYEKIYKLDLSQFDYFLTKEQIMKEINQNHCNYLYKYSITIPNNFENKILIKNFNLNIHPSNIQLLTIQIDNYLERINYSTYDSLYEIIKNKHKFIDNNNMYNKYIIPHDLLIQGLILNQNKITIDIETDIKITEPIILSWNIYFRKNNGILLKNEKINKDSEYINCEYKFDQLQYNLIHLKDLNSYKSFNDLGRLIFHHPLTSIIILSNNEIPEILNFSFDKKIMKMKYSYKIENIYNKIFKYSFIFHFTSPINAFNINNILIENNNNLLLMPCYIYCISNQAIIYENGKIDIKYTG